jgi:hypothetical protein
MVLVGMLPFRFEGKLAVLAMCSMVHFVWEVAVGLGEEGIRHAVTIALAVWL